MDDRWLKRSMRESTPSSTTLAQPTSNRARLGGGDNQLALTVTPKPTKLDRGRDSDDDMLRNKKPKSHGFGTAQLSEITDSGKKMRADPGGVASPLALPPSTAGIDAPPFNSPENNTQQLLANSHR